MYRKDALSPAPLEARRLPIPSILWCQTGGRAGASAISLHLAVIWLKRCLQRGLQTRGGMRFQPRASAPPMIWLKRCLQRGLQTRGRNMFSAASLHPAHDSAEKLLATRARVRWRIKVSAISFRPAVIWLKSQNAPSEKGAVTFAEILNIEMICEGCMIVYSLEDIRGYPWSADRFSAPVSDRFL